MKKVITCKCLFYIHNGHTMWTVSLKLQIVQCRVGDRTSEDILTAAGV